MTRIVGAAISDESAALHVTGQAVYTDDLLEPEGIAHGVLVLSRVAHGHLHDLDLSDALTVPGVLSIFTAKDIPGANNFAPRVGVDPLLADDLITYLGQPLAIVIATSRSIAEHAASLVRVDVDEWPMVLNPLAAHASGDYVVPPMRMVQPTAEAVNQAMADAPRRLSGSLDIGGQEHFYLETQSALATVLDDGAIHVRSSTQHPTEVQHITAHALGIPFHRVRVECRRMGGAFGGKESFSAQIGAFAALAAVHVARPVKVRLDRRSDDLVTGKRHPFHAEWEVGFDDDGRILAYQVVLISNGGHSSDMSAPVMARAMCHVDGPYFLPAVTVNGYSARTHTQSNTAFRGFGGPQGALVTESVIDDIARSLGRDPLDVRLANIYGSTSRAHEGDAALVTPYGMVVEDNVLPELLEQILSSSNYRQRRIDIGEFNASSPVLKRGIAITPLKFGIAFNLSHLNQAGALVHVYLDGSVVANHAGTEMGQGLNTKVIQVVAEELGVPVEWVRSTATDSEKVANTSATAASSGADLNGAAAQIAAGRIKARLCDVAAKMLGCAPDQVTFVDGEVRSADATLAFAEVVTEAYRQRQQLWSDGYYATPGLHWDPKTIKGRPFFYFCYGAAVAEVMIDTLTGEHRVLRADLLQDVGRSLNPRIDIGQVEGGFVQGMGWLTTEELRWHPQTGALETLAPTTYKVPAVHDIPANMRVELFDNASVVATPHLSKAVGEPPLLLAFSVFLAIKDAVAAARGDNPVLNAPATAEEILRSLTRD